MTISLDKLQDLFALRLEYSSKLGATERQIRCLVEGPDSQDSGPAAKTPRKQRTKTENPNDMQKVRDESDGSGEACSEAPGVASPTSDFLGAIGEVMLQGMVSGSTYSKAELLQFAIDASGEGADLELLKNDVGNSVRKMVADGLLTKTGEAKGTRYTRA